MNILYLEDEPHEADLVKRYFKVTPHRLTLVDTLDEAWAALDHPFELMLVDMRINESRQGYEFVEQVRAGGFAGTIIAVTGLSLEQDVEKCYEVGCTDILLKPYTITQLDTM